MNHHPEKGFVFRWLNNAPLDPFYILQNDRRDRGPVSLLPCGRAADAVKNPARPEVQGADPTPRGCAVTATLPPFCFEAMALDLLRTLTPLITFFMMLGLGIIGWFIRRLIEDMSRQFGGLRQEFRERLDKVERGLDHLEAARLADYQHVYERFVPKEWFLQSGASAPPPRRRRHDRARRRPLRRAG